MEFPLGYDRRPLSQWACMNLSPASFAPADLPIHNSVLTNSRRFLVVNVQKSGKFAKIAGGFAKTNDAGVRIVCKPISQHSRALANSFASCTLDLSAPRRPLRCAVEWRLRRVVARLVGVPRINYILYFMLQTATVGVLSYRCV